MADYEYKPSPQVNVSFGETFSMSKKAPAIAKRIFDTYQHAKAFVNNTEDTAVAGLLLTVVDDKEFKYVAKKSGLTYGEAQKMAEGEPKIEMSPKLPVVDEGSPMQVLSLEDQSSQETPESKKWALYEKENGNGLYQIFKYKTKRDPEDPEGLKPAKGEEWINDLKLVKNASEAGTGGGSGATYQAGTGITLDTGNNSFSTASDIIPLGKDAEDKITVTNPMGSYVHGQVITIETAVRDILMNMLSKEEDVTKVLPSVSFSLLTPAGTTLNSGNTYDQEVGDVVKGNLNYSYPAASTGQYKGWWLKPNPTNAMCPVNKVSSKFNTSGAISVDAVSINDPLVVEDFPYNEASTKLTDGTTTLTFNFHYDNATVEVNKNNGKPSTNKIVAGTVAPTIKLNTRYKYFYKFVKYIVPTDTTTNIVEQGGVFDGLGYEWGWCSSTGKTEIKGEGKERVLEGTAEAPSIVILVPQVHGTIINSKNGFGQAAMDSWELQTTGTELYGVKNKFGTQDGIIYTHNGVETKYNVFYMRVSKPTPYKMNDFQ